MTEYMCSCHIEGKTYELLTCGAITTWDAMTQFAMYVDALAGDFTRVDGLSIDLIDVE